MESAPSSSRLASGPDKKTKPPTTTKGIPPRKRAFADISSDEPSQRTVQTDPVAKAHIRNTTTNLLGTTHHVPAPKFDTTTVSGKTGLQKVYQPFVPNIAQKATKFRDPLGTMAALSACQPSIFYNKFKCADGCRSRGTCVHYHFVIGAENYIAAVPDGLICRRCGALGEKEIAEDQTKCIRLCPVHNDEGNGFIDIDTDGADSGSDSGSNVDAEQPPSKKRVKATGNRKGNSKSKKRPPRKTHRPVQISSMPSDYLATLPQRALMGELLERAWTGNWDLSQAGAAKVSEWKYVDPRDWEGLEFVEEEEEKKQALMMATAEGKGEEEAEPEMGIEPGAGGWNGGDLDEVGSFDELFGV